MNLEDQRNKIRLQLENEGKSVSMPNRYGIKRYINGEIKVLSKKANYNRNKSVLKPPKIFYGLNTTK